MSSSASATRRTALLVLSAVAALSVAACDTAQPELEPSAGPGAPTASAPGDEAMLAGIVLPPSALRSDAERRDFEAATKVLVGAPQIDGVRTLVADGPAFVTDMAGLLARESRNPVCLLGPGSNAALPALSAAYPHTRWCAVEARSVLAESSGFVIGIRAAEGAYVAGAMAARVRTPDLPSIGFLGAARTPALERLRVAFEAGARSVAPDVTVVTRFLTEDATTPGAGTDDANAARLAAGDLYDADVSIVFTLAADSDLGVLEAAAERERLVIGLGPTFAAGIGDAYAANVLVTVLLRWDVALTVIAERLATSDWQGVRTLGLVDDAVHIQPGGAPVFGAIAAELEALRNRIIAGDEPVPAT